LTGHTGLSGSRRACTGETYPLRSPTQGNVLPVTADILISPVPDHILNYEDGTRMVTEILNKLLVLDGVIGVMVVGKGGNLIECIKSGLSGPEALATAVSFVLAESETVAHRFGQGALTQIAIEFNECILIAVPVTPETFLVTVAKSSSNIGQISLEMKKNRDHVALFL
jgi:predicted regulator of Ras-like GTPase activity (Roadblock/LC7/MglB family)